MTKTKRPTTLEATAAKAAAEADAQTNDAIMDLALLNNARLALGSKRILRHAVEAIESEMEWLVRESEVYRMAAAKLYIKGRKAEPTATFRASAHDRGYNWTNTPPSSEDFE